MKLNKTVLPLALALSALLATTACRHTSPPGVTKLPKNTPAITESPEAPPTLPSTPPIEPAPAPFSTANATNGFPTAEFNLPDFIQDRAALAADTVHFKFDSAVVEDSEQAHLAAVAQALSDQNLKLLIEGNCDERGTEEYNRSLGERRALALREALAKDGVDPMRVKTISYGKDKPVDPGHDESAWAKNRRGEFILLHPKTPAQ
jgi:peptidoglycan-associated lipoprotein